MFVCRSRKGKPRDIRKIIHQRTKQAIVWPEIMPPFRHAMRLINGKERYLGFAEQSAEFHARRAFGRDIEQIEFASPEAVNGLGAIVISRSQSRCSNPHCICSPHLIMHQRNERRNHNAGAVHHEGWKLIAKRLASAGWHNRQSSL